MAPFVVAVVLTTATASWAQVPPRAATPRDGIVVALDGTDLVIDLGAARGVVDGQVVELWRPLRLRHPVTGQMLVDRFRIGSLKLTQVQNTMSLARVDGVVSRPPAPGDLVVVAAADRRPEIARASNPPLPASTVASATTPTKAVPPAPARAPESPVCSATDADADELSKLFVDLTGAAPDARAEAYATFARSHPKSRFVRVLGEEASALRREATAPSAYEASIAPVARLRPGIPQRLAFELDHRFKGAVVHARKKGATSYRSMAMASVGPGYWTATLPGDAIDDSDMQYFVEGVPATGAPVPMVGSADHPKDVAVERRPSTGKSQGTIASVQVQSEYASFNTKATNDYVFQTEGQSGWRLGDTGIRAVRSGFGVLRGKGGRLTVLDGGGPATDVGLTYGYVEAEWGLTPMYAIVTRPIIGLRERGVSGGAQAFFRIGSDLRTNLTIGGEVLGTVGLRGVVQLDWRTIPRVPIVMRSEVTNQPAGTDGDLGARAIVQVGYEFTKELTIAGRGSYQGRTINHAGPGAGLGVNYAW